MRARALLGMLSLGLVGGCALVFNFGDYKDANTGGGGSGGQASSSSSGTGGASSSSGSSSSGTGGADGCKTDTDCAPPKNPCLTAACAAGICGTKAVPAQSPPQPPILGNCKSELCDGMGGLIATSDDTDLPNDGNECTQDGCSGGTPTAKPLPAGSPCGTGLTCDANGQCAGCVKDTSCPPAQHCVNSVCVPLGAANGSSCTNNGECASAYCVGNVCCNSACPVTQTCSGDIATTQSCPGGTCVMDNVNCFPYGCTNGKCDTTCTQVSGCAAGLTCEGASCCAHCGKWMTGTADLTYICGGSSSIVDTLRSCACNSCINSCLGICDPNTGVPSGNCLGCLQLNCQMEYDACMADP